MNKYDADDIMQGMCTFMWQIACFEWILIAQKIILVHYIYFIEIVSWSLAKQAQIHFSNEDSDSLQSYNVHDMILDYLKDTIDSNTQTQYHIKLVERLDKFHTHLAL